MAMFKTLADLKKSVEQNSGGGGGGDFKDRWLTVKDGQSFRIRFLQELTPDASGYTDETGIANVAFIHTNPDNFRKSAVCTRDFENWGHSCWACEQVPKNRGWSAKQHVYINVAVFDPDEKTWSVKILDQKFTAAHVAKDLMEYAGEYGTITDRDYKISRSGEKQKTQYSLIPLAVKDAPKEVKDLELFDLEKVFRTKAPAEQPAFYLEDQDKGKSDEWE